MADITMKQNDTRPALYRSLGQTVNDVASYIPLTAASRVTMYFRNAAKTYVMVASCVIASAAGGVARHDWVAAESATTGIYEAEFEILWNDATIETVPNDGYFSIEFVDDIGP